MAEAAADGYDLPRREGSDHVTPIDGVTATIMTRLDQVRRRPRRHGPQRHRPRAPHRARDPRAAAGARVRAVPRRPRARVRRRVARRARDPARRPRDPPRLRRLPGDRATTSSAPGRFDDAIGLCGAPIEDHGGEGDGTTWRYLPDGATVGIPLRSLIVRDGTNALVAGRCFSATHDAHASIRSMAQCMAMGQAAGTTAALAAAGSGQGLDVRDVPVAAVLRTAPRDRRDPVARDGRRGGAMTLVRTVLGDIAPDDLGVTYSHEHLVIDGGRPVALHPDFDLGDVDRMVPEVARGGRARPARRRRCDAVRLRSQRRQAGRAVAPAGSTSSPRPGSTTSASTAHWSVRVRSTRSPTGSSSMSRTASTRTTMRDRRSTGRRTGPASSRSPAARRAVDAGRRVFAAAAETHRRTGAPILTHCEAGTGASSRWRC